MQEALDGFKQVLEMEESKGEWGFKALKQIVKLHYRLEDYSAMLDAYKEMLHYANGTAVTKNAAEKKINSVLDFVSESTDSKLLQDFYGLTLNALAEARNERLWFKTNIKLANLLLGLRRTEEASKVLKELHAACQDNQGIDDARKGTQLLEVYALQIQLHTEQGNSTQLKDLYEKSLAIKSAIPHPRIMGVIRECGGKIKFMQRAWDDAATDFFEAFKSYDEAGSGSRTRCLKYLVLASMLMESKVDPFDSQEAKPYRNDPQISAMTSLIESYQAADLDAFERILSSRQNSSTFNDPFILPYIDDLRHNVRSQVVQRVIRPYERVHLEFVARELKTSRQEAEQFLLELILDGKVSGKIDQLRGVLQLGKNIGDEQQEDDEEASKYSAMSSWAQELERLQEVLADKVAV